MYFDILYSENILTMVSNLYSNPNLWYFGHTYYDQYESEYLTDIKYSNGIVLTQGF